MMLPLTQTFALALIMTTSVAACALPVEPGEDERELAGLTQALEDYRRTVVLIRGETQPGQDMFVRGGIDHELSGRERGIVCTSENFRCALPMRHRNRRNATTEPWKVGDGYLDWYGRELFQTGTSNGAQAQGSASDWTTSLWPSAFGVTRTVARDGYGLTPLHQLGLHQWALDVDLDCSAAYFPATRGTPTPIFEVKSFISNGPGWEPDVANRGWAAWSRNHVAVCGAINIFERGSERHRIVPFPPAVASGGSLHMVGEYGMDGDTDTVGRFARMRGPTGLATDGNGFVYVADTWNHKIKRMRWSNLELKTYVGSGVGGSVDGVGSAARLQQPAGLATDQNGTLYVADRENHQIRRVRIPVPAIPSDPEAAPTIELFAGASAALTTRWGFQDGFGTNARFRDPGGMAVDGDGNLYVADRGNARIRKIVLATGEVSTLAGSGTWGSADGVGTAAQFAGPEGVAFDGFGALYVADTGNHTLRRIDLSTRQVTTVAGLAGSASYVDALGSAARLNGPTHLVSDMNRLIHFADSQNGAVRTLDTVTRSVTTRRSGLRQPYGITRDGLGNLYVSEASGPTLVAIGE